MFVNIPIIEYTTETKEEFDDISLEMVDVESEVEVGETIGYVNTDHIVAIIPASKTRCTIELVGNRVITANKSIDEMANLLQRVNVMHGHLQIPAGVF